MNYKIYKYWKEGDNYPMFYSLEGYNDLDAIVDAETAMIFKLKHPEIHLMETEEPTNYHHD